MAEHHEQVSEAGKKVEALKSAADSPEVLKGYASAISQMAKDGVAELKKTPVKSEDAKKFLDDSVPKVTGFLSTVAADGQKIIEKHKNKEDVESHYKSLDDLKGNLKNELNRQKESIGYFAAIEKSEQAYEKLREGLTPDNASTTLDSMNAIIKDFPMSTGATKEYHDKVEKKIKDFVKLLNQYLLDATRIKAIEKDIKTLEPLVKACEEDPSPENMQAFKDARAKLNIATVDKEVFVPTLEIKDVNAKPHEMVSNYQALEARFKGAMSVLEGYESRINNKEKEGRTVEAEKMLTDVDANEKSQLTPLYEKYSQLALLTTIDDETQLNEFLATEEALLSGYLMLQMTVGAFNASGSDVYNRIEAATVTKIQNKATEFATKIRQIEVNRQTRKSRESLSRTEIFGYVTFLGEEKDGKIYSFNTAYDALGEPKKTDVRMAIESIIAQDQGLVKQQTTEASLRLLKASGNVEKIGELLGEKSGKYVEGLQKLMAGKNDEAKAAFTEFVSESSAFSKEDLEANGGGLQAAVNDAKEKIQLMGDSTEYFDALEKMKNEDPDGAAISLKSYLDKMGKLNADAQKIHTEQISNAKNLLKLYSHQKLQQLDGLIADVCTWKQHEIIERADFGGNKLKPEDVGVHRGPEASVIKEEVRKLRDRVEKGEMLDFNAEFAKIKERTTKFLSDSFKPEDNVIDKLSELYEGLNSGDPKKKKETLIKFAKELREQKSYDLARQYLDKALRDEYREAAKDLDPSKMKQTMLDDPKVMEGVRGQAQMYFDRLKKDNPGADLDVLRSYSEQMFFNMAFKKQYTRDLRKNMTDQGLAEGNEALELYNDWSPHKTKDHWYEVWKEGSFDAETYDDFKREAAEFAAITVATLPIGGIGGAAAKGGGTLLFRGAAALLLRGGARAAGREAAIAAFEQGGIMALKSGTRAFAALEPAAQSFILQNEARLLIAGGAAVTGGLAIEAAVLMGGSNVSEGIITGRAGEISWANFGETAAKAFIFRGIGAGGNKLFGNAMKGGGAKAAGAVLGMESLSGLLGTGVEAAALYAHGKGSQVDTGFILGNLLQNALQSGGTHIGHGLLKVKGSGKMDRSGKEIMKAYYDVDGAAQKFGVDFSKPNTITSARVTPQGDLIINGKQVKGFNAAALEALPASARERVLDLAPNSALDTHYRSKFSTDVPKELWPDPNNPASAKEVHGWVDKDGRIHFNLDHLNEGLATVDKAGNPYRDRPPQKIMPEGYRATVDAKGDLVIVGRDNQTMSYHEFLKSADGKKSLLANELKRVKTHEATHQALEAAFSKTDRGKRVEDPSKTGTIKDMFAKPDGDGNVPEGKVPLVDHNGKPMEPTWQNIQEYLCHVGDGSIQADPSFRRRFERVVATQVPGFTFTKARQISTKMLARNPRGAFVREFAAASHEGAPEIEVSSAESLNVKSVDDLTKALASPDTKTDAQFLIQDLMGLINRTKKIGDLKQLYPDIPMGQLVSLASALKTKYEGNYAELSRGLAKAMDQKRAARYADTELDPMQREMLKAIIDESKDTNRLLSSKKIDGSTKSPLEIQADLANLHRQLRTGEKGLGEHNLRTLLSSEGGKKVVVDLMSDPKVVKSILASEKGLPFLREQLKSGGLEGYKKLPPEAREALKKDALASFKEKIFEIDDLNQRHELLKRFTDEELEKWFTNLEKNPNFGAQENLPALIDVLIANQDQLSVDYLAKILQCQAQYKTVQVYENGIVKNKKIIIVEGVKLGEGGFGAAYKHLLIDSKSPEAKELVMKKPIKTLDQKNLTAYKKLDAATKAKVDAIMGKYRGDDLVNIENFKKAEAELSALLKKDTLAGDKSMAELVAVFHRQRSAALEARNNKIIMKYQSLGKLKGFMRPHYVAEDGSLLIMESLADTDTGKVRTLKAVMEGKVDVDPQAFWGSLADTVETLHELHELGLIHHDLKPDNIAIGADGKVRILDFGSMMNKNELAGMQFAYDERPMDFSHVPEIPNPQQIQMLEVMIGTTGYAITPGYYDHRLGYQEAKGAVPFGSTDYQMIVRTLKYNILGNSLNHGSDGGTFNIPAKYITPEKIAKLEPVIKKFEAREIDGPTFAKSIRTIMVTP